MTASTPSSPVIDRLSRLRELLESTAFPLDIPSADDMRGERRDAIGQIDDYLMPRLRQLDAPVLAVVGGSTGAGKSTLVNSLIGREVSLAGVLRPTTRAPVLVCHPDEVGWFSDDRILPNLPRTTGTPQSGSPGLQLVVDRDVAPGLAILDAPDIDSVVESNRDLAAQLLAAADLWLFATTAARYADAVPWNFLRVAQSRSTSLAVVLNRVPPEAEEIVGEHLAAMLDKEGLGNAPLFVVRETSLADGLIPEEGIAPLRNWLNALIADAAARDSVVRTTLDGALENLGHRVPALAGHLDEQLEAADRLRDEVGRAYDAAMRTITDALKDGTLLRGEVLSRWQDVVGTGDVMRTLEARIGWLRDRIREAITGAPSAANEVSAAVETSLETLVVSSSDSASERVIDAWGSLPGGPALLASAPRGHDRSSSGFRNSVGEVVRAWQGFVLELVAAEGASKRATGRALSLGVNGLGVALMVATFAHTGGLTGGEVAIAGGTAAVSQKLLEAVFGDQAVRELSATARSDLLRRMGELLEAEAERYRALLDAVVPSPSGAKELRASTAELRETIG